MINQESKTLREFSFTAKAKNKDTIKVRFGYDTSARHSGYYLNASVNGQSMRSDASTMKRVRSLGIDVINRIIDSIGLDVTGAPYDLESSAPAVLCSGNVSDIQKYFRITEATGIESINKTVAAIKKAKSESAISNIVSKFINGQRLRLLEINRDLIQEIRDTYQNGIQLSDNQVITLSFEGILRRTHNPLYYKRDMDYIRKARVRLFKNVLKRNYRPF